MLRWTHVKLNLMKFNLDLPSASKRCSCFSLYFSVDFNMLQGKVREEKQIYLLDSHATGVYQALRNIINVPCQ